MSLKVVGGTSDTFLDFRLPLVVRLEKLALIIGSDSWSADQGPGAESLIREAALMLTRLTVEATAHNSVLDAAANWNNSLRAENARLLARCENLEEENRRLFGETSG